MSVLFWIDMSVYFLSSVISLALCLMVLGAGFRNRTNQFFSLFTFSSGIWTFFAVLLRLSLWLKVGDPELFGGFAALVFVLLGPALLLFTSRYVQMRSRISDIAAVVGYLLVIPLTIYLFQGKLIRGHWLDAYGTTHVSFHLSGYISSIIPFVFLVWSIVLFVRGMKRLTERYNLWSAVILLAGMVLGALIDIPFPVLSFATIGSVGLLGFGVVSKQLFNPLKERNVELQHEIAERLRTEEALRRSESHVKALLAGIPDAIFYFDRNGIFLDYSGSKEFDVLLPKNVFVGKTPDAVLPPQIASDIRAYVRQAIETEEVMHFEYPLEIGNRTRYYEARIVKTGDQNAIGIVRDVTRKKELESQILQTGKMEAIGRIAGGIAHDFNNLLTILLNFTDLCLAEFPGAQTIEYLNQIKKGILQASELTRQLLAFSRKQILIPRVVNLNRIVSDMERMIERLLGGDVEPDVRLSPGLHPIRVDPTQMQQVIMNLAVNARDALPAGGKVFIRTENIVIGDSEQSPFIGLGPGAYVRLSVKDTGSGMDRETVEHIFEPFFTTKKNQGGTGLGLSTVHGIVMQSNGDIRVESEPGKGTEFSIVFPAVSDAEAVTTPGSDDVPDRKGLLRTVLLVEDEELIRTTLARVVESNGHQALTASNAHEAIDLVESVSGIDLVVSDIRMPGGMSGIDLVIELRRNHPKLRVILMTGFMSEMSEEQRRACEGIRILHKPFDIHVFIDAVREVVG
jgi:signal transduction histidine kinase